jgi:hypothetical protein
VTYRNYRGRLSIYQFNIATPLLVSACEHPNMIFGTSRFSDLSIRDVADLMVDIQIKELQIKPYRSTPFAIVRWSREFAAGIRRLPLDVDVPLDPEICRIIQRICGNPNGPVDRQFTSQVYPDPLCRRFGPWGTRVLRSLQLVAYDASCMLLMGVAVTYIAVYSLIRNALYSCFLGKEPPPLTMM